MGSAGTFSSPDAHAAAGPRERRYRIAFKRPGLGDDMTVHPYPPTFPAAPPGVAPTSGDISGGEVPPASGSACHGIAPLFDPEAKARQAMLPVLDDGLQRWFGTGGPAARPDLGG